MSKSLSTLEKISADTLALELYMKNLPDGATVSYAEVQQNSGVTMDKKGRTRWVTAAKRASRIFMVTRGFGYTMSSPENAATIVKKQLVSLDNKVKKAEVVTNKVLVLHSNQMDKTERQSVQAVSAMFAQVRILSDAYKHEQKNLAMSKPRALGALIKGSQ